MKTLMLSVLVGVFLSIVGAFGTEGVPLAPRTTFFAMVGVGCGLAVIGCVSAADRVPALRARPTLRRVAIGAAMALITGLSLWLVIGWLFLHGPAPAALPVYLANASVIAAAMTALGWAVFRRRHVAPAAATSTPPRFLERLPFRLRGAEIYAVEAEDHYLRIHTSQGSDLILMRLSDAIVELDGIDGARTHRSWWVAKAAVRDVRRTDGRATLTLKDGAEVPVSRTQMRALRASGWF